MDFNETLKVKIKLLLIFGINPILDTHLIYLADIKLAISQVIVHIRYWAKIWRAESCLNYTSNSITLRKIQNNLQGLIKTAVIFLS